MIGFIKRVLLSFKKKERSVTEKVDSIIASNTSCLMNDHSLMMMLTMPEFKQMKEELMKNTGITQEQIDAYVNPHPEESDLSNEAYLNRRGE